jgi:Alginate export
MIPTPLSLVVAVSQITPSSPAEFPLIRYELDAAQRTALPPGFSILVGGELRERYEYTNNPIFGGDPQDENGVWLQRLAGFSDLHWGRSARLFVELHSAIQEGRAALPAPLDEDQLEFQNLLVEGWLKRDDGDELTLRVGRQEMQLGSARLVAVRDGPNVRYTFDGGRVVLGKGPWSLNALAVRPRKNEEGVFDDSTDDSRALWGVYVTRRAGLVGTNVDVYYLGYHNAQAIFDQGTDSEQRHTIGARVFGSSGRWYWNWEPMIQIGSFGDGDILAWTVASVSGYTWSETKWTPTVELGMDAASGDHDPNTADLETFNPMFPRGNYFSQDATLGPLNFYDAHLFLTARPHPMWELTADAMSFWRLSTGDGVYRPTGRLMRSGLGSDRRFVATSAELAAEWTLDRNWSGTFIYSHLRPEDFLQETGPSETLDFFEVTVRIRF